MAEHGGGHSKLINYTPQDPRKGGSWSWGEGCVDECYEVNLKMLIW